MHLYTRSDWGWTIGSRCPRTRWSHPFMRLVWNDIKFRRSVSRDGKLFSLTLASVCNVVELRRDVFGDLKRISSQLVSVFNAWKLWRTFMRTLTMRIHDWSDRCRRSTFQHIISLFVRKCVELSTQRREQYYVGPSHSCDIIAASPRCHQSEVPYPSCRLWILRTSTSTYTVTDMIRYFYTKMRHRSKHLTHKYIFRSQH